MDRTYPEEFGKAVVDQLLRYNAMSAMYHPILYTVAVFSASTAGSLCAIRYASLRRGFRLRSATLLVASFLASVASGLLLLTYYPVAVAFDSARVTFSLALARTMGHPLFFAGAAVSLLCVTFYLATSRGFRKEAVVKECEPLLRRSTVLAALLLGVLMLGVAWSSASIAGLVYQYDPNYRFPGRFTVHNSN